MGIAVFSFVVMFLLIGSGGLLLFYRAAMLQRISAVVTPRRKARRSAEHAPADGLVAGRHGGAFRPSVAEKPGGSLGVAAAPDPRRLPRSDPR